MQAVCRILKKIEKMKNFFKKGLHFVLGCGNIIEHCSGCVLSGVEYGGVAQLVRVSA
jgi:hypothetical protein